MLSLVAACGTASSANVAGSDYTNEQVGNGSGGAGEGLPCDVAALLASNCTSCHSNPPVANAPMSLLTYGDLTAPSKSDPSKSYAEVSVTRMQSAVSPMPPLPGAPASAAEQSAFAAWVMSGTPMGTCGGVDAGPDPFAGPPTCTSGTTWTLGTQESKKMEPGHACIQCHVKDADANKQLSLAGTVYPTGHEPDNCNATAPAGDPAITTAIVEITDKNGKVVDLPVNSVGNFYRWSFSGTVAKPYTAKVKYNGKERIMVAAQTSGDCNSCHTQDGASKAPGRVLLP